MKELHRNIVEAVVQSLQQIFEENKYADNVIEKMLKSNSKWGSRDRRFIAETTYEIVRWHRMLCYLLDPENEEVTNQWDKVAVWFLISAQPLPTWKEFAAIDTQKIKSNFEKAKIVRKIRESVPDWMDDICAQELGNTWDKELPFLNEQADVALRANTLKIKPRKLQSELLEVGIETELFLDYANALVLKKRQNVIQLEQFQRGMFEVQDAGSQLISPFLKVAEGMCVIDACAGAGGKSLHLAALMQNSGKLIAMDIEPRKLEELKKRAQRANVSIIETKIIDDKVITNLTASADRLLLDVPCSGIGVLRRNPDAKWKLSLDFIDKIRDTQQQLLQSYSQMLRSGGLMVYATCSILPSENREQVDKFLLSQDGKFELEEERIVMPSEGFDGFYMARLKKN